MKEIKFDCRRVRARMGLLDFIKAHMKRDVLHEIGKNPERWIEELGLIAELSTRDGLVAMIGMPPHPAVEKEFRTLGNNTFFYDGQDTRSEGLWLKKRFPGVKGIQEAYDQWTQYRLKLSATLEINPTYGLVRTEQFLPENFERTGEKVLSKGGEGKRPITKFTVECGERQLVVYAKGADTAISHLTNPPSYRLTSFAGVHRTTSEREMKTTLDLMQLGVNVPPIIGCYDSSFEQFLFLEGVQGEDPKKSLDTHREAIIAQDASMLAALCLGGYRKQGFPDFDDKLFDGKRLWLIDVDECSDLYFPAPPDYRALVMNPTDQTQLRKFRSNQQHLFQDMLRDAIFEYRESLTPTSRAKEMYIRTFFKGVGWPSPSREKIKELTTFPKDYMTTDRYFGMMMDND